MPKLQFRFLAAILLAGAAFAHLLEHRVVEVARPVCTVLRSATGGDDAPTIIEAFRKCGRGGTVVFGNGTYHVNSVMNTTGLSDCQIELHGTLLVSMTISSDELAWEERRKLISCRLVEFKHVILAESLYANWISKPINGMVLGRHKYQVRRVWERDFGWQWPGVVRPSERPVELSAPPTSAHNLEDSEFRLSRSPLCTKPDVVSWGALTTWI